MNYATFRTHDVANGPGVRVSLFVSGCTHRCPGCFNSEAWDFSYGEAYTEELEEKTEDPAAGHSFQTVSQLVTAKIEGNLRAAPTTDSEVLGVLKNGEFVERIGVGDRGWDRLLLNGRTVYAVASYLEVKE